ncbi:hypothetical protein [Rhodopila sp.]|uniref:hypothetical protein n=1 Tax=Rhodopila sp. TaxID=2480087 RepID=UPI003D0A8976
MPLTDAMRPSISALTRDFDPIHRKGGLTMDPAQFRDSLAATTPPQTASLSLQALWWDAKGDWAKAHQCAQSDPGPTAAAVHAYLHRKEPDPSNAKYWYGRAGRPPADNTLQQEWHALVSELLPA